MIFHLTIELGNDAMNSSNELAEVLRHVASRIDTQEYVETCRREGTQLSRGVLDYNGNQVGDFILTLSPSEEWDEEED